MYRLIIRDPSTPNLIRLAAATSAYAARVMILRAVALGCTVRVAS